MNAGSGSGSRFVQVWRMLRAARATHPVGYPWLAARFADANLRRQFSLREIRKLDLFDPSYTGSVLDEILSKRATLRLQERLNPESACVLTRDKRVFYRHCMSTGLPAPQYFGSVDSLPAKASAETVASIEEQASRVLVDAHDEVIVKPAKGAHGEGVAALRREQDRWVDLTGTRLSAAELPAWLARAGWREPFVVQERLFGHPDLERLSGTRSLQTVRMITYLPNDGVPIIGGCQLRIVGNDALVDNFANGALGNLIGNVPAAVGRLSMVFVAALDGSSTFVDHHPRTGATFHDFPIPFWEAACALVRRAALAFRPLRTIGWDVGITAAGPVLIEGNEKYDPPQLGDVAGEIVRAMRNDGTLPLRRKSSLW